VSLSAVPYRQNAERHAAARDVEARLSTKISRARLAVFLLASAFAIWTFSREVTPVTLLAAVALFTAFGALVVWHARVESRIEWLDARRLVNLRAIARLRHDWSALPPGDAPPGFELSDHPYALDLDLFGRASLFQWLGPAATPRGSARLASWLLFPKAVREIVERQDAIAELATADEWRLDLSAHGLLAAEAREPGINQFLDWAEGKHPFGSHARLLHVVVFALMLSIWALIAAHATGLVAGALWSIPLVAGIILSFAMARQVGSALDRAGAGLHALARYAAIFEHAAAAPKESKRLAALQARLSADGLPAHMSMRRLNRILGFGELRRGAALPHFLVQALTLWDFHVIFALERWRRTAGSRVRDWLEALGEIDALALLAAVRRDNPAWAVPEIGSVQEVRAEAIGHPLIADDRRVPNSIVVGPPGTVLLVTGSNMSGKSTLLRAIGLNVVLAQAGGCVCAQRMSLPESDLQASIRVQDSLERGLSYFMAALARLKGVVDAAEHEREGRLLVFLLDEILQGTNSAERQIAVCAITRHLLEARAIGAMTTHDLSLADAEPFKSAAALVHFSETIEPGGAMQFDYRLKPGLATSKNALRLMQMIGIDL
jgi:ABC-type multidrug transport system fused ATPase/permease subunit